MEERKKLNILVHLMALFFLLFEQGALHFVPCPANYRVGPTQWSIVSDKLSLIEEAAKIRCSPGSL